MVWYHARHQYKPSYCMVVNLNHCIMHSRTLRSCRFCPHGRNDIAAASKSDRYERLVAEVTMTRGGKKGLNWYRPWGLYAQGVSTRTCHHLVATLFQWPRHSHVIELGTGKMSACLRGRPTGSPRMMEFLGWVGLLGLRYLRYRVSFTHAVMRGASFREIQGPPPKGRNQTSMDDMMIG